MGLEASDLKRLSSLLDTALDLAPEARAAWLDALPADEKALAPLLRELLARHASGETLDFIDRPPAFDPPRDEAPAGQALAAGTTVGHYRLLRELGVGGMGEVWLAERADGTLKRQVALKLPRASWTPGLAERMARERDILGTLEHAHIARLYDAGTDTQGRPWLALEYVEGQPIDVYCRERSLGLKARLALLLQVATAVAFAHTRLVVHRDLKPSNILVNAEGQVRLLDFGIAKLMEGERTPETQLTRIAGRALTLDYASPEQIRGEPIGTASDVYSLGVVGYELLAGTKPYRLKRGTAAELEEAIALADAPLASAAASDPATKRLLKGDLDAILNKALKKAPVERYATVDALAQDIERYLAGHRVVARPDSPAYRLARFVRRYRTPLVAAAITAAAFGLAIGVGATALVILALLLGLGAALWQARKAREQAEIARTEARTAAAVQDFLEGVFKTSAGTQSDPLSARQRTALDLLDEGAQRIEGSLNDSPRAKLRVLWTLATIYDDLGETERMADILAKRVQVYERLLPGERGELAAAYAELANALAVVGRDGEARDSIDRAAQALAPLPDVNDEAHLAVDGAVAQFHAARGDPRGLEAATRLTRRLQGAPLSVNHTNALMLRGKLERFAGYPVQAVATLEEGVALARKLEGGGENTVFVLLTELGLAESDAGRPDAAFATLREALRVVEGNAGPASPMAIIILARLGQVLTEQGRAEEALQPLSEARRRVDASTALAGLAGVVAPQRYHEAQARRRLGQLQAAEHCYAEALALTSGPDGSADPAIRAGAGLALTLALQDRLSEARETLDQARSLQRKADLRGFAQSLMLAEAQAAILLARHDIGSLGSPWQSLQGDELFSARLGEPGPQVLKVLATWADQGTEAADGEARALLASLERGPPLPNRDYEVGKLRGLIANQLAPR